jgi:flagellar hook assembly protein FlgD
MMLTINFGLNKSSKVEIEIYDVTGKKVNTIKLDKLEAGNHSSKINTSNLNAEVFTCIQLNLITLKCSANSLFLNNI